MSRITTRRIFGLLLVVAGILLLFQNVGVLLSVQSIVWMLLFAVGGIAFLTLFLCAPAYWWAAIPGFALLSLAALIGLDSFLPQLEDSWGGSFFLGGLSLGFWLIYLTQRVHWWAIIPGGVLLTLAVVAGLATTRSDSETGSVFFVGLALTFGVVALAPIPEGRMTWALIPAAVLAVLGLAILTATIAMLDFIGPVALIVAGLYLVYRTLRPQHATPTTVPATLHQSSAMEEQQADQAL